MAIYTNYQMEQMAKDRKSNMKELSLFPKVPTKEEIEKMTDMQILKLLIKEKRTQLSMKEANRTASIRRMNAAKRNAK